MSLLRIGIVSRTGRWTLRLNKAILIPKRKENRRGHAHPAIPRRTFSTIRRGFPARQSRFSHPAPGRDGADGVCECRAAFSLEPLDPVGRRGVAVRDDLADVSRRRAGASPWRTHRDRHVTGATPAVGTGDSRDDFHARARLLRVHGMDWRAF